MLMLMGSILQLDVQNPESNPDRNQSFCLEAAPVISRLNWVGGGEAGFWPAAPGATHLPPPHPPCADAR